LKNIRHPYEKSPYRDILGWHIQMENEKKEKETETMVGRIVKTRWESVMREQRVKERKSEMSHRDMHLRRKKVHAEMKASMEKYKQNCRILLDLTTTSDHPVNPVMPEREDPMQKCDDYW
jgi:hypothetical protein